MTIYPAILTGDIVKAQSQLKQAKKLDVSGVHLDVIDGFYADNLTLTPADFALLDFGLLKADFHLMVDEPMDYLYEIIDHKTSLPTRAVIGQVEKMSYPLEFVTEVKRYDFLAGLSLDLFTPLDEIEPKVWEKLDVIQLMGVRAGFQGQDFNRQVVQLVKEVVSFRKNQGLNLAIIVDGGVNLTNISLVSQAGADAVAVGSGLWQAKDVMGTFKQLSQA